MANVLLIMLDDARQDDWECMSAVQSRVGDLGTRFKHFYAPGPLCSPNRAAFMKGRYPHNTGVNSNKGWKIFRNVCDQTIATWLTPSHRTAIIGKFMNGYGENGGRPPGWDTWKVACGHSTYNFMGMTFNYNGEIQPPSEIHSNTRIFQIANNFIEDNAGTQLSSATIPEGQLTSGGDRNLFNLLDHVGFTPQQQEVAAAIAKAESTFDATADNNSSSATGLFQILHSYWPQFSVAELHDALINARIAKRLHDGRVAQGDNPWADWNASRSNWENWVGTIPHNTNVVHWEGLDASGGGGGGTGQNKDDWFLFASFVTPHTGIPHERRDSPPYAIKQTGAITTRTPWLTSPFVHPDFRHSYIGGTDLHKPNDVSQYFNDERQAALRWQIQHRRDGMKHVDSLIGKLLDTLVATNQIGKTYVIVVSDNGFQYGEHGTGGKNLPYQESVNIPLTIRGPGIRQNYTHLGMAAMPDLAPTILDMVNRPDAAGAYKFDGTSLLGRISDPAKSTFGLGRAILLEGGNPDGSWAWRAIVTRTRKYIEFMQPFHRMYFDRSVDPEELHNLYGQRPIETNKFELALDRMKACDGLNECDIQDPLA